MKKENNLVIQKADKYNTVVILDKDFYLKSVEKLLKDFSKFKNIIVAPDEDISYIISSEKRVTDLLKNLKNKNTISEGTFDKLGKWIITILDPFFQQLISVAVIKPMPR